MHVLLDVMIKLFHKISYYLGLFYFLALQLKSIKLLIDQYRIQKFMIIIGQEKNFSYGVNAHKGMKH